MPQFTRSFLYSQVQAALVERIATGRWKPGTSLPNEHDLAQEFGVSDGTMRKALNQMEGIGLISRRQGRGTFVIDQTAPENILRFVNLRDANGERLAGTGRMLAQAVRSASSGEIERLQVDAGELVVWTKRLRSHQGKPLLVEERSSSRAAFRG